MSIIRLIEIVIIMCGVIFIYDARPITKKLFSFGDRNEAVFGLKVTGYILSIIGGLMLMLI